MNPRYLKGFGKELLTTVGTPVMPTLLGPSQSVLISGVSLFKGCFYTQHTFRTAHSVRMTVDVVISGVSVRRGFTVYPKQLSDRLQTTVLQHAYAPSHPVDNYKTS